MLYSLNDCIPAEGFHKACKQDDYYEWLKEKDSRLLVEKGLIRPEEFTIKAKCAVCEKETDMQVDYKYAWQKFSDGALVPNWRERMFCPGCRMIARARLAVHAVKNLPHGFKRAIYMPEAISAAASWICASYDNVAVSEYMGPGIRSGELIKDGIVHQDLCRLGYGDGLFSLIVCLDVLEHVADPSLAISEMFRVLEPGGILVMTVPFDAGMARNRIRARINAEGTEEHFEKPVYHVDPFAPGKGALVFTDFGWQLMDDLGQNSVAAFVWSREQGYLGDQNIIFYAMKE